MGTKHNKRKDKLRRTKKHVVGGDGEKEVKYIIRKSKLDDKNVMFQVFVNAVPTDFSITNLLQNNMNMVDEMLARLRRKKNNDEDDDVDIIHEETIKIGHTPPKPGLEKEDINFEFNKFFINIKDKVKTIYDATTTSATADLKLASETVNDKTKKKEIEELTTESKTAADASINAKNEFFTEVEKETKAKAEKEAKAKAEKKQ